MRYVCDRIMVMYLGQVMEIATKDELYAHAQHPYTQALLSSIPIPDVDVQPDRIRLSGELPSPFNPPVGCRFNTRCRFATEKCKTCQPELRDVGGGHMVACHRVTLRLCGGKNMEKAWLTRISISIGRKWWKP